MPGGNLIKGVCGGRRGVPKDIIILLNSATIPNGWTRFSAPDNKYIVGAGSTYNSGDTGGSSTVDTSGKTSSAAGAHTPTTYMDVNPGSDSTTIDICSTGIGTPCSGGNHQHAGDGSVTYTPPYRQAVMIKNDASYRGGFPINGVVLSTAAVANLTNIFTDDKLIYCGATVTTGGSNTVNGTSGSAGAHIHSDDVLTNRSVAAAAARAVSVGAHTHNIPYVFTQAVKRKLLSAWSDAVKEVDITSNVIALFESSTPPAGWFICNGSNGTPDLRDYFIELVTTGSENATGTGDNTVDITSSLDTNSWTHDHSSAQLDDVGSSSSQQHTSESASHAHTLAGFTDKAYTPPYYALYFIMLG